LELAAETKQYPSRPRAIFALSVLLAAYIISFVDRQILSLMVNPVRSDLRISDFEISLLQGLAFALFYCLLGIPFGRLADRTHRVRLIAAGVFFWSIMTILCGFANTFLALFLFRMGVGIGEAVLAPAGYSILSDYFPPDKNVRATSVFALGPLIGAGCSLLLGGQLLDYIGSLGEAPFGLQGFSAWQLTFVAVGLPGLAIGALVLLIREPARQGVAGKPAMSLLGSFADLWHRRRDHRAIYVSGPLLTIVTFSAAAWFPTHLIRTFGMTPGEVGIVLGVTHLAGGVLGASLGVILTERWLRRGHEDAYLRTVCLVACLVALTMVAPLLTDKTATLAVWFVSVTLQCAFSGNIMAALHRVTPNRARAFSTAIVILLSNIIGLALGTAIIGAVAQIFFEGVPRGIGYALAIVNTIAALTSALVAARGTRNFRQAIARGLPE